MIQSKTTKKKQKKIFRSKLKKSSSAANKEVASGINFIVPQKGHLKFSIIQGQNWYFFRFERLQPLISLFLVFA